MIVKSPETFRQNIKLQLNNIIEDENYAVKLEKAIYNSAIREAKEKNVIRKWENKYFSSRSRKKQPQNQCFYNTPICIEANSKS